MDCAAQLSVTSLSSRSRCNLSPPVFQSFVAFFSLCLPVLPSLLVLSFTSLSLFSHLSFLHFLSHSFTFFLSLTLIKNHLILSFSHSSLSPLPFSRVLFSHRDSSSLKSHLGYASKTGCIQASVFREAMVALVTYGYLR